MSFLDQITAPIGAKIGGTITDVIFGKQDRVSNRDFEHAQNLADKGNPREIARQNDYLAGTVGTQAAAYNTYQDSTYGADTDRQADRVKTMASELGMSPWELTGGGGANPVPSPQMQQPQGDKNSQAFMSQAIPLQIAKMNNQAAIAQTKMQTDTQKQIAAQTSNDGQLAKAQTAQTLAQQILTDAQTLGVNASTSATEAQERLTSAQTSSTWFKQTLDLADMLLRASPTDTFSFMGQTTTGPAAGKAIMELLNSRSLQNTSNDPPNVEGVKARIPANNITRLLRAVGDIAKNANNAMDGVTNYLSGSTTRRR